MSYKDKLKNIKKTLKEASLDKDVINAISREARVRDPKSLDAVLNVVHNRMTSGKYAPTVRGVLSQKGQFQAWGKGAAKGLSDADRQNIQKRWDDIESGRAKDITGGANEFRTTKSTKHSGTVIGGNTFFKTGSFAKAKNQATPQTTQPTQVAKAPQPKDTSSVPSARSSNFKVASAPVDSVKTTQTQSQPKSQTPSSSSYSVQKGDTLSSIAKRYGSDVDTISKTSGISDPNKIKVGQNINVAGASSTPSTTPTPTTPKEPTQVASTPSPSSGDDASSFVKKQLAMKEARSNEISAELVGKVSNARFWRKEAPSKTLSRAINKKFIESGKKKEEIKKAVKEAVMAMPPQIQPPAIHGSQRAGVQRQVSKPTEVSGKGAGRMAGSSGSISARPNVKVTSGIQPSVERSWKAPGRGTMGTGGGSMSATPKVTTSFSQGGVDVGTKMAASKQTSPVVKGMTSAGREASNIVSKAAPTVAKGLGTIARVAGGPAATAAMAVMSPTPAGAGEDEKKRQETLKSYNPYKAQGRSVSDYEKQVLTPKSYETPKASTTKVDAPTPPTRPEYFTRGQAFQAARGEAGGGSGKFSYQSGTDAAPKEYQTNVKGEPYKPESQLKQTSVKEETKMDNKQQIYEAIDNILENNLNEMVSNFSEVLQEKAIQKLEEKKKEIAANYFAQ